jgi:hypothetical protein
MAGIKHRLNKISAIIIVLLLALFTLPQTIFAAILPQCGYVSGAPPNQFYHPCEYCHLFQLGENIINFIVIDISIPLAAVAFAIAGFIYITAGGNSGKISRAHGIFKNVAIGLIIILASWLVVDVIMKTLVKGSQYATETDAQGQSYFPWADIKCLEPETGVRLGELNKRATIEVQTNTFDSLDRSSVEQELTSDGIGVDNDECQAGSGPGSDSAFCTSLNGINRATVDSLGALKSECDDTQGTLCTFTITTATEGTGDTGGQYGHTAGNAVTINSNATVNQYFVEKLTAAGEINSEADLESDTPYGPININDGSQVNIVFTDLGSPSEGIIIQTVTSGPANEITPPDSSILPTPIDPGDNAELQEPDDDTPPAVPPPGGPPSGP